jgi:sialic acid synthase SpsE
MRALSIGNRTIGAGHPCFIIAEIGTAHGGDLAVAQALIRAAAGAGADCVKTQVVIADEIVHPRCGEIELPGGKVPIYERFRQLETGIDFFREMKAYTESLGLVFLASAFGLTSARLLCSLDVAALKIASPELNHFPLLDEVNGYGLPVILSTGVSLLGDIEEALARLPEATALLHCVTSYPAPEEEYNLAVMPHLAALFGRLVGVSDHSREPILVPVAAVIQGAALIEKHFTLERSGHGLDDSFALDPKNFQAMTWAVRRCEDKGPEKATRNLMQIYDREHVERVFGDGRKTLAPSEAANYATTRRSLLAVRDIAQGEAFTAENIALLRSEKNLSPGLHPRFLPMVMSRRAARAIPSGQGISWLDL